jgi:hypothetical protein
MISIMDRDGFSLRNKEFSVKTVMMAALAAVAVLAAVGYVVIGPAPLYDATTMGITLALCGFLLIALLRAGESLFPMFIMLTTFSLLFIFTRVLTFLYLPEKSVLPLSVVLSVEQINAGYIYIAIGTGALGSGFWLGYLAFKNLLNKCGAVTTPIKVYPLHHLAMVFATVCVIQLYVALWLGAGVMGDVRYGVDNKFEGVLSVLFNSFQALLIVAISVIGSRKQSVVRGLVSLVIAIFFLMVITLLGSRSGGLQIFQVMLIALLVIHGNSHQRLRNYFLFMLGIAVSSFALFPVATEFRSIMLAERDKVVMNKNHVVVNGALMLAERDKVVMNKNHVVVNGALNRLGASFDTAVLTLVLDTDQELQSRTMNLPYAFKSAINVIVPGEIYAEAHTNTSLLWPFIYKLRDQKLLNDEYYETFSWTAYGTAYGMFGWWAGIMALLIAGIVLQVVYMGIVRHTNQWLPYFSAWFLMGMLAFIGNMGLDDWLVGMQRSLFSMLLVFFLLWAIGRLARLRIFARWERN